MWTAHGHHQIRSHPGHGHRSFEMLSASPCPLRRYCRTTGERMTHVTKPSPYVLDQTVREPTTCHSATFPSPSIPLPCPSTKPPLPQASDLPIWNIAAGREKHGAHVRRPDGRVDRWIGYRSTESPRAAGCHRDTAWHGPMGAAAGRVEHVSRGRPPRPVRPGRASARRQQVGCTNRLGCFSRPLHGAIPRSQGRLAG